MGSMMIAAFPTEPEDVDQELIETFVQLLSRPRSRETLAVLRAVAAVADPRMEAEARRQAEEIAADFPEPPWGGSLEKAELAEAWRATHPFGDQDEIMLSIRYPGRADRLLCILVDRTLGNVIKDTFVAPEVEPVLERSRKEPDFTVDSIPVPEAAGIILSALNDTDARLDPPVSEDFVLIRAFAAALVRRVPNPMVPRERRPMPDAEIEKVAREFLESDEATDLPADAEMAAHTLVGYQASWMADDPLRWSPMVVEMCLLHWMPRKVILKGDEMDAFPPTLRALVRYAGRRRGLPDHLVAETLEAVDRFTPDFVEAMKNPGSESYANNLWRAMEREGVDVGDHEKVSAWIERFNERPIEERDQILGGESPD